MFVSTLTAVACGLGGLLARPSHANWPSGPAIVLLAGAADRAVLVAGPPGQPAQPRHRAPGAPGAVSMSRRSLILSSAGAGLCGLAAGVQAQTRPALRVVASFSILADWVREVGGPEVEHQLPGRARGRCRCVHAQPRRCATGGAGRPGGGQRKTGQFDSKYSAPLFSAVIATLIASEIKRWNLVFLSIFSLFFLAAVSFYRQYWLIAFLTIAASIFKMVKFNLRAIKNLAFFAIPAIFLVYFSQNFARSTASPCRHSR